MSEGNQVSVFGQNTEVMDMDALANSLDETKDDGARSGETSFVSFSGKTGTYKIGVEAREPEETEPWLVNISGFELGWICWKGGNPAAKRMANVSAPRVQEPMPDEGGPFDERKGEGWYKARAIVLKSLETEEQAYFSNNSKSGVSAMADLQKEVVNRMKTGQPCWPVITLSKEQFESQGFKNYKPTFEAVAWLTTEAVSALGDPNVDPMSVLDGAGTADAGPAPEPKRRRL